MLQIALAKSSFSYIHLGHRREVTCEQLQTGHSHESTTGGKKDNARDMHRSIRLYLDGWGWHLEAHCVWPLGKGVAKGF